MITEDMLQFWSTLTLREALTKSPLNESVNWQVPPNGKEEKTKFIQHLSKLRKLSTDLNSEILDKRVTGDLSQGWRDLNRDNIFFQDCLASVHRVYPEKWTPADYLLQCYISAKKEGVALEDMDLGRALRNLPSFMREYLIAGKLSDRDGIGVKIPSETMNAKAHVDLILRTEGKTIYVWSYLSSKKAIYRLTNNKLSGSRGKILPGLNLLAPFEKSKDAVNFKSWWIPSSNYIDSLIASLEKQAMPYEAVQEWLRNPKKNMQKFSDFILFEFNPN